MSNSLAIELGEPRALREAASLSDATAIGRFVLTRSLALNHSADWIEVQEPEPKNSFAHAASGLP